MYLASLRRSWQFFSCRSFQTNLKSISDSPKEWPRITKAPFSSIAIVSPTNYIRNCLLLADGQSCPKPQPYSTQSQTDPLPSKKTRRWYKRLEIVLPALIALGIALRVLLDEFSGGDKSQEKRKPSQQPNSENHTTSSDDSSTRENAVVSSARDTQHERDETAAPSALKKEALADNVKDSKSQGSWTLIGPSGWPVSDVDLRGSWLLVFFGLTQCPDVCPKQLERNLEAIEAVERASGGEVRVRPVMVTEDPERDTPAVLARYCASYSPRLLGLSGSEQQVIECKRLYYVDSGVARALGDPDGDLLLDHTVISYLVDPTGRCVDFYERSKSADDMCRQILRHTQK